MSAVAGAFLAGLVVGVLANRGAAWVAARARIVEAEDEFRRQLSDERQLQRWREQALLRGEGISITVVQSGEERCGAVTTDETVVPIRRRMKGEGA